MSSNSSSAQHAYYDRDSNLANQVLSPHECHLALKFGINTDNR